MRGVRFLTAAAMLVCGIASAAKADGTGWFSSEQVAQGRWEYSQKCGVCHGAQLQGGGAPALKGRLFDDQWDGKPLKEFYNYVHQNMPLGQGGDLNSQEYADIVAFILAHNGLPAGEEKLTPKSSMERVLELAANAANAPAAAAPGEVKIGGLYGKLAQPSASGPTQAELDAADSATTNWLMYNKGYRGERYSTLAQIDTSNAANLRPICMFQLGELGTFSTGPVMYDGILYVTTHLGTYAIDATTCKLVWKHQHVAQGPEMNATNKGIAIAGGRVIRGTQDGFLFALDAKTGAPLWVRQVADWRIGEGIGAAPIVWNDIVYVAKAGGDWGIHGRMMAFHVEDGSPAWSFDLIPGGGETGADTWPNAEAAKHGGGAAWVTYALDRETGTLFVPVGNPGPDFHKDMRPGDNLFTISTVALDARTGKLKWWYQLRPNDDHDWDATVVSLFDSEGRKLVATAGKEGILHVVDRETGKLVFKLPMTTVLNHDAPLTPEGVRVCPVAGVQWNGAAHSPATGLLYVNAIDWCSVFKLGPKPHWVPTVPYTGLANGWGTNDPTSQWSGWINAVDPKTGEMAWRVHTPTPMYAALTPTAGGVLFTGDLNGNFLALDAGNGKRLYSFDTGGPIAGGVITYEANGRQYVAVASGSSGGSIPLSGAATVVIFGQKASGAGSASNDVKSVNAAPSAGAATTEDQIKRGEYLAQAGDCVSCHTAAHGPYGAAAGGSQGVALAGGLAIDTPYGALVSPNITPDDDTGIGTWTADDFWRAMHLGINKRGEPLYPAMPYVFFTKVTREDADAIFSYLKSLKPVKHAVDVNQLRWPFDMRYEAMSVWQALYFTPGVYKPDPTKSEPWNRGAYLVEGLGHCGACHTPRNFMGAVEPSERFSGAVVDDWFAPNITTNRRLGIGGYTVDELTDFFKNGVMTRTVDALGHGASGGETTEPLPTAVGPMAEVWHNSLRYLTDADAKAMATYLEDLPAAGALGSAAAPQKSKAFTTGARLFVENCAPCHGSNGAGQTAIAPPIAANPMVIAPSPDDLLSIVLGGQVAEHNTMMMPAFKSTFSNAEIADLLTYVRGAWGNDASPVSAGAVASFRSAAK